MRNGKIGSTNKDPIHGFPHIIIDFVTYGYGEKSTNRANNLWVGWANGMEKNGLTSILYCAKIHELEYVQHVSAGSFQCYLESIGSYCNVLAFFLRHLISTKMVFFEKLNTNSMLVYLFVIG